MHIPVLMMLSAAIVLIPAFLRSGAAKSFIVSAACGLASLWAVSLLSAGGSSLITTNVFTASSAALLGIPGVISMLILRVIALI